MSRVGFIRMAEPPINWSEAGSRLQRISNSACSSFSSANLSMLTSLAEAKYPSVLIDRPAASSLGPIGALMSEALPTIIDCDPIDQRTSPCEGAISLSPRQTIPTEFEAITASRSIE
ncbi:hypothetical protein ABIB82_007703 [Bradyrhizobium sp. i1.8.4]|uniref:hypothetical protein n=1 Tax=unclassified Bradyrhizobium TaxID=2631580 RepID=UPI003D1B6A7E